MWLSKSADIFVQRGNLAAQIGVHLLQFLVDARLLSIDACLLLDGAQHILAVQQDGCASSQRAARSAGLCGCCWCLKPGGGGGAEWLAHTRVIAYEQAQPVLHAHVLLCRVASHSSALQVEVTGPLVRGEQHK